MNQDHRNHWDRYWRNSGSAPVFARSETADRALEGLEAHWSDFFSRVFARPGRRRILDMACGSGAVTSAAARAAQAADHSGGAMFCLDYSLAAIADLRTRFPQTGAVAADAATAPFADGAFDAVASQFGLEYAGPAAFERAARLLAQGGSFCAICHLADGPIDRECRDNLETVEAVIDCRFLPLAKAAFSALYALDRGHGSSGAAQEAHRALAAATTAMRELIKRKGPQAANGAPALLHRDVTYMYNRRRNYEPREVFDWIDVMTGEITAYAGRMQAMSAAALDDDTVREIRDALIAAGLTADEPSRRPLASGAAPAVWCLEAVR